MKIIALEAENLKRLTAVHIEPDGNMVQITGKNGQGKTSVLDAIWWALSGNKNVQTTPIRKGEESAIIRLDLGELKVQRKFIAQDDGGYTTSITVENGDGARFQSPQTMLDKMLGELTFDPLAFTRMKPEEQARAMRSLVPDFDFDANDAAIEEAFDQRTTTNREAKAAADAAVEIGKVLPDGDIEPEVDADELFKEWEEAVEHNDLTDRRAEKRTAFRSELDRLHDEMARLKQNISDREAEINGWEQLPKKKDVEAMREKLRSAQDINRIAEQAERRDELSADAKKLTAKSGELTKSIDSLKAEAKAAIASADLPIRGIEIADGMVLMSGIPFDQASDAQQLSASISIAMALNPTLRVIRVRDGSLLDEDAMKVLTSMADESDYQIWIERVDNTGTVGFVMEDGHVKGHEIATSDAEETSPKPEAKSTMFSEDRKA